MARSAEYRLPDEPRPGALSRFAVRPMWPVLSVGFGGAWFAWGWFLLNGWALGTPTRLREFLTVLVGFAGNVALLFAALALVGMKLFTPAIIPYLFVIIFLWKVAVCFQLQLLQERSVDIYEYFGGTLASGGIGVVVSWLLGRQLTTVMLRSDEMGFLIYKAVLG